MKRLLLALALATGAAFGQTTPQSLLVTRIYNIRDGVSLECGVACIDNRSQYTRRNNYHSFQVTGGVGVWEVKMQYSDVSATSGPWVDFGSTATVTNASTTPIGFGNGYHPYIRFSITGTATIEFYSGAKDFALATAVNSPIYPTSLGQGGTGSTTGYGHANVKAFGAEGDGVTDDTEAIEDAIDSGLPVFFPCGTYVYTSTINFVTGGMVLTGEKFSPSKWTPSGAVSNPCVTLDYQGGTAAISTASVSGTNNGFLAENIYFSGASADPGTIGLLISVGDGAGYAPTNMIFRNVAVMNFPSYQVKLFGGVIDIRFENVGLENTVGGDHLVYADKDGAGNQPTQVTWDNCFFHQKVASKWAVYMAHNGGGGQRFFGGTVAVSDSSSNGIKADPGIYLFGTHLEGAGSTGGGIGIEYNGPSTALIFPELLASWTTGIQIGTEDDKAYGAYGSVVAGNIAGNGTDVKILDGGVRKGTVLLSISPAAGIDPVVSDLRFSTDGVAEVVRLDGYANSIPPLARSLTLNEGAALAADKYLYFNASSTFGHRYVTANNKLEVAGPLGTHADWQADGTAGIYGKGRIQSDADVSSDWSNLQGQIRGLTNIQESLRYGYDTTNGRGVVQSGDETGYTPLLLNPFSGTSTRAGPVLGTPGVEPADADLTARSCTFWLNEGADALTVKCKYADGTTVKSGTVAIAP